MLWASFNAFIFNACAVFVLQQNGHVHDGHGLDGKGAEAKADDGGGSLLNAGKALPYKGTF